MRADRLVSILLLLQTKGHATTADLAKRLEVSPRTIHRDMEALTSSGVPVYAERGSSGGWRLLDEYRTNLTGLSESEIMALFALKPSQLFADLGLSKVAEQARIKMLAALPAAQRQGAEYARQRILVDIQRYQEAVLHLPILQEAVWQDRKLWFVYDSFSHGPAERTVDPLGLVVRGNIWYLVASRPDMPGQEGLRTYRVSRIRDAQMLAEPSHRPPGFDLEAYWHKARAEYKSHLPTFRVVVRIEEKVLQCNSPLAHWGQVEQTEPCGEGWLKAQIRFELEEQALAWVLSTASYVEVLEPEGLRQKYCSAVSELYKKLTQLQNQNPP